MYCTIHAEAMEHSIFTGTKYLFCRTAGASSVGDPYGENGNKYYWQTNDAISVLFSPEHLEEFRPNIGTHEFVQECRRKDAEELEYLKKHLKSQPKAHKDRTGKVADIQAIWKDRIAYLEQHRVDFIKIIFDL